MTSEEYKEQLSEALGKLAGVHAVGDTWITFDGSIPAGGVPFTGQLVSRAMYADLWAWVQANKTVVTDAAWQTTASAQNGMNAAYSSGDGSTTFRLPCVVGGYLQAGDTSTAGQYVKEGMPNVYGWIGLDLSGNARVIPTTSYHGALIPGNDITSSQYYINAVTGGSATLNRSSTIEVNASRSSPVYRDDCQHVTPETFKVLVGVYAFGVTGPVGEATAEGIVAEMNRKADIDASSFSTAGKNVLAGMGMPSGRYVDLTLGASGTTYTAPANGWVAFRVGSTSSNATAFFLYLENLSNGMMPQITVTQLASSGEGVFLPVRKGDVFKAGYHGNVSVTMFRFIYAEGAS